MHSQLRRYGLALAAVFVAATLRFSLVGVLGYRYGFSLFLVSTFLSGRYLGFGPSVLALLTGTIPAIGLHFVPADQQFDQDFQIALIVYLVLGGAIVGFCRADHKIRSALENEIVDRRAVEAELRESRQHLLLAIEAGQLGTWELDMRTNRVEWSALMEPMHGYAPGTFGGTLKDAIAHNHPDDREQILLNIADGQGSQRMTYRVILPGGQLRWIQGVGETVRDAQGTAVQMLGVCSDVTEQTESEIALRQAEEKFRILATHAPVGIIHTDPHGNCLFANQTWCEIVEATIDEALGNRWQQFVHPEDRVRFAEEWRIAIEAGRPFMSECRLVSKHGAVHWIVSSAAAMLDSAGRVIGYIGTAFDVTDRKVAEDVLRASQARLQGILDNTTAVIYLKDREGRYLMINKQYEDMFHTTQQQIVGKTDVDLFPSEFVAELQANDRRVRDTARPLEFEEVVPHDDGPHTYVTVKFPITDAAGAVVAVGGISTDISDRKRALDALEAEQELLRHTIEVQEQERQLVTYEIHDGLVQSATGALMQLEGIQDQVKPEAVAAQIENVVGILRRTVAEGRRLINGIRTPVLDDAGIVAAVEQLLDEEDRAHVKVEFVKDAGLGRMAPNIEEALYRITQEALTNICKHSQSKNVRIELGRRGDRVNLEVQDWGVGFTPSNGSKSGHGLKGMTKRARIAGGRCTIESAPAKEPRSPSTCHS